MDVVETVSSLHPLISLHSSISMNKMDKFFDNMTAGIGECDLLDSSETYMSAGRLSHQESMIPN